MAEPIRFPEISLFQGFNEPVRAESDIHDLEVIQGAVPEALNGTLYRCGPETQYPPRLGVEKADFDMLVAYEEYFNGEGMVHRFRFENGHVDYRSRWVRNERFLAQEKARRSLFGRYRNRYTNDELAAELDPTTSNTHVVWHSGRLLALKEDGLPIELDPVTLETKEKVDFEGQVTAPWLSAHPKIDALTDEMHTFAYQAKGDGTKDMAYYRIDTSGKVVKEVWFEAPYAATVHDYALAGDYVVFGFFPLITDMDVVRAGGPYYQWHRDEKAYFAVLPVDGTAEDIRWFNGPAFFGSHIMNGHVDGSRIVLDVDYSDTGFIAFPNHDGAPYPPPASMDDIFRLCRVTLDLDGGDEFDLKFELPPGHNTGAMSRCDDRFVGQPYRHGYSLVMLPGFKVGIAHIDHETGEVRAWDPGDGSASMEPVFVPAHREAAEGEGYLLVHVNREREMVTDLVILDAQNVDGEPVATIRIPTRIRLTFHGSWVGDEDLAAGTSYHRPGSAS
ncbi:carotenoid oxygenase family protein [Streptomyces sp. NPDC058464]|uniref:carotenoid oxygenase family protein n=1 Tax=Streptomyces sp. NPDC058464 TaxID=3346511 RepID=UPI003665EBA1